MLCLLDLSFELYLSVQLFGSQFSLFPSSRSCLRLRQLFFRLSPPLLDFNLLILDGRFLLILLSDFIGLFFLLLLRLIFDGRLFGIGVSLLCLNFPRELISIFLHQPPSVVNWVHSAVGCVLPEPLVPPELHPEHFFVVSVVDLDGLDLSDVLSEGAVSGGALHADEDAERLGGPLRES